MTKTMAMKMNRRSVLARGGCAALLLATVAWMGMGCEGDGDGGSSGGFVGTWALYAGGAAQGTPTWYAHFKSDSTFFISNNRDGSGVRVTGTYSVSGGRLTGPFKNPGTGEGRVEATISGGVMNLQFIEYWHTPNKVIPYTGKKV